MIKNIEDLKNIQIVCKNQKDIEDCLNILEELGFEVRNNDNQYQVIFYREYSDMFENDVRLECGVDTYFYNKKLIKILKKFIKEKQEKIEDIEVASDGRIIKINNCESNKEIFVNDWALREYGIDINDITPIFFDYILKYGLAYETKEAREKAMFKLEIETKLKNIAERLNDGRKIEWKNELQEKFYLIYNHQSKTLDCFGWGGYCQKPGVIYCLDKNFLEVAKQEIGEEDLIKYFKE